MLDLNDGELFYFHLQKFRNFPPSTTMDNKNSVYKNPEPSEVYWLDGWQVWNKGGYINLNPNSDFFFN